MGTELIPAVVCSLVHTLWSMSAVMTCYEEDDAVVDKKRKRKTKKHWNEKAFPLQVQALKKLPFIRSDGGKE